MCVVINNICRSEKKRRGARGFSFLELILSVFTGSLLLAGSFYAYNMLARQFESARSLADLHSAGHASLSFIAGDLRKAGRIAYDDAMGSSGGAIADPVTIINSENALFCCDTLQIEYDASFGDRRRVTYYGDVRDNVESRYALYMNVDQKQGEEWIPVYAHMFVADYVVRFDAVIAEQNDDNLPKLVDLELVLRAKKPGVTAASFATPAYSASGHNDDFSDRYARKWFKRSVMLRNVERY